MELSFLVKEDLLKFGEEEITGNWIRQRRDALKQCDDLSGPNLKLFCKVTSQNTPAFDSLSKNTFWECLVSTGKELRLAAKQKSRDTQADKRPRKRRTFH